MDMWEGREGRVGNINYISIVDVRVYCTCVYIHTYGMLIYNGFKCTCM